MTATAGIVDETTEPTTGPTTGPTDAQLRARFGPLFERIAAGAVEREQNRRLAIEEAGWLRDAGFTAIRVPRELGGDGVDLRQLFALIVDLAAAESNLPHALRIHFRFLEERRRERDIERGRDWLRRITGGAVLGTAVSERDGKFQQPATTLRQVGDRLVLNGTKYYNHAIFEVGGSSALDHRFQLDRHWRNARTLASHNPATYRERQLGDFVLTATHRCSSRWRTTRALRRESRDDRVAARRAEQVADDLQAWSEAGTADGFTVMPAETGVDLENFATLVVPILQDRGLFQKEYAAPTLRGRFGLPFPHQPHVANGVAV
ncbi:hypothetical protein GCM10009609_36340 [Pseudonocardia aurantiaca]|uniref:Monooxygenase n=1 Tax=Pseudonocardia aurantiaca TaxID=75290 RepID=A0ABW4FTV6_9PSEU